MKWLGLLVLAGCSAPATPPPSAPPQPDDVTVASPDAGVPEAVLAAPAWVFGYHTADRDETWTLRYAGGEGLIEVVTPAGVTRYTGTATEGDSLALDLTARTAKIALDCKHLKRPIGAACNDPDAPWIEVLDCYHPDFETPMPFAAAPGVEYVVDATCNGYRLVAP